MNISPLGAVTPSGNDDIDALIGHYLVTQFLRAQFIAPVSGPVSLAGIVGGLLQRPLTVVEQAFFDGVALAARDSVTDSTDSFFAKLRIWSAAKRREEAMRVIPMPPPADPFSLGGAPC